MKGMNKKAFLCAYYWMVGAELSDYYKLSK